MIISQLLQPPLQHSLLSPPLDKFQGSGGPTILNNFVQQDGSNFVQQDGVSVFLTNS